MVSISESTGASFNPIKANQQKGEVDEARTTRFTMLNSLKGKTLPDVFKVLNQFAETKVPPMMFYSISSRITQAIDKFSSGKVDTTPEDFKDFLDSQNNVLAKFGVSLKLDINSISKKTDAGVSGNANNSYDNLMKSMINLA